jgi:hypothetical protein
MSPDVPDGPDGAGHGFLVGKGSCAVDPIWCSVVEAALGSRRFSGLAKVLSKHFHYSMGKGIDNMGHRRERNPRIADVNLRQHVVGCGLAFVEWWSDEPELRRFGCSTDKAFLVPLRVPPFLFRYSYSIASLFCFINYESPGDVMPNFRRWQEIWSWLALTT